MPPSPARSPASCISRPRSATSSSPSRSSSAPGRDQRRELAKRVAGHEVSVGAAERLPAGEARAEDRRLRVVGALVGPRERVLADDLGRQLEQIGAHLGDGLAHLGRLAALAGKQDCRLAHAFRTYAGSGQRIQLRHRLPPVRGETCPISASRALEPFREPALLQASSAALVTGASAGIGARSRASSPRAGTALVLVARRKERLDELPRSCRRPRGASRGDRRATSPRPASVSAAARPRGRARARRRDPRQQRRVCDRRAVLRVRPRARARAGARAGRGRRWR